VSICLSSERHAAVVEEDLHFTKGKVFHDATDNVIETHEHKGGFKEP
jgi:hypothetical protein